MLRRENILITEDYMSKTTSATHFTAPGEIECFDSSIHFGKESDRVEIQNCNIKSNVLVHCSKDDTYDFETGALIALMKMCGVEKVKKAAKETFFDVAENSVNEYEEEIKRLTNISEGLYNFNSRLIDEIDQKNHEIISLKALKLTNESLKKENEKLHKNIDELFESDTYRKSEVARLSFKNHRLEEENEKLKLDCEKLQHGYIDTDMIFCGGRQNGKQYTFLVDLFKKIDQKKVDAAYKEAYNTKLPVWQKEVLNQMYGIYKESKDKIELPRTLDINGTVYRKSIQIKDFGEQINKLTVDSLIEQSRAFTRKCVDEWLYKPPTKREEMWDDILTNDKVVVKVKKEDVNIFLKELETRKHVIRWLTNLKPSEALTNGLLSRETHSKEYCYFYLESKCRLWYDTHLQDKHKDFIQIDYLPPMRWDLFKKGRIVVGCTEEEVPEFREKAKRELGNIRIEKYSIENLHCNGPIKVYYHYDKDTNWLKPLLVSGIPRVKVNNHKVYYWEDVR